MQINPYVSVDFEFTALNIPTSQILEIGAVYDDGVSPIDRLPTFNRKIFYNKFMEPELDALVINGNLLKEIREIPYDQRDLHSPKMVLTEFALWLESLRKVNPETGKLERLFVAGKNAAGTDIPVLKNNCVMNGIPDITQKFNHRTLDAGSVFFDVFGMNVSLSEINKLTGRTEVSHRALDDAYDVVYALRYKIALARFTRGLK